MLKIDRATCKGNNIELPFLFILGFTANSASKNSRIYALEHSDKHFSMPLSSRWLLCSDGTKIESDRMQLNRADSTRC
jgi:hypothetical protein